MDNNPEIETGNAITTTPTMAVVAVLLVVLLVPALIAFAAIKAASTLAACVFEYHATSNNKKRIAEYREEMNKLYDEMAELPCCKEAEEAEVKNKGEQ